jgi:protoheme IX farnesyltransferase
MTETSPRSGAAGSLRDVLELLKPGITGMAIFAAAGALALAPGVKPLSFVVIALTGIAAIVGAANVLNQFVERDSDRLMTRTRLRPLPDGRMAPAKCLVFGLGLAVVALAILFVAVNVLTAALGVLALGIYVLIYTPMKRRTTAALLVGAVPGAMPVLMGWTSATGRLDPEGIALFLVLFAWQIPHFLAISVYRQAEYDRAGLAVVPTTRGLDVARRETLAYTAALLPLSLSPVALGLGGWAYGLVALACGGWLLAISLQSFVAGAGPEWAPRYFRATLAYLPALGGGLLVDGLMR